jgi:anaerobic nitric oxide reductase flavorubredoxin
MSKPIEIAEGIFYVGYKDWNVRDFHGYTTSRGSTYNSYLIMDENIVLIDTVKWLYADALLDNISGIVDPAKIDFLVSNHTEPDHSSSIPAVLAAAPNATVIASAKGESGLKKYFGGEGWKFRVVNTGDSLEIGKRKLEFITTPMVHWPDSMMTFLREQKLLFSMDAFGQHLAASETFDDEVPFNILMQEAKKYYANIIMHLGPMVKKTLDAAKTLPIETICPSHGIIWRKHIPEIVSAYYDWAECKPSAKLLIIYDTMWNSTEIMAKAILEGAESRGFDVRLLKLSVNDLTDVTTEALDAAAIVVGTPTLNNCMLPTVASFLTYMEGLKPKGKIGAAFGSHGWAGGGAKAADASLQKIGIKKVSDPITCIFRPDAATLDACRNLGAAIADAWKK